MRRSTIWIDCSIDWRMRSVIAGGVMVSWITRFPASTTSSERCPVVLSNPPSGWESSRNLASAALKSLSSRMRTSTLRPRTTSPV